MHELGQTIEGLDDSILHHAAHLEGRSRPEREALVDTYFRSVISLIRADICDTIAHLEVIERNPALAGLARPEHYERVCDALIDSNALPGINAGLGDPTWPVHPQQPFFEYLEKRGIEFVLGSDAHSIEQLRVRDRMLAEFVSIHQPLLTSPRIGQ